MNNIQNDNEYLSTEFNAAVKYTNGFLITKLISILGGIGLVILLIVIGVTTSSGNIFTRLQTIGTVILVALIGYFLLTAINITYNILGAIKFGNVFGAIDYRRNSPEESKDKSNYSHEILLTTKNMRNFLWMNLGVAIIGGIGIFISIWLFLFLIIANIVLMILIGKYVNKLKKGGGAGIITNQTSE